MAKKDEGAGKPVKVRVCRNGPYVVTGRIPVAEQFIACGEDGIPLRWRKGKEYPVRDGCALCRCGRSRDKPHCDGSHEAAGFDGTENAKAEACLDRPERTEGPGLVLSDVENLCAVALFCHRAGDAWNLTEGSGDPEKKSIAMQEVRDCPSGRLTAVDRATGREVEPELEPSLGLVFGPEKGEMGPLWVRGGVPIESADGRTYRVRNRVTLCRCGRSRNKPFCDGEHRHLPRDGGEG